MNTYTRNPKHAANAFINGFTVICCACQDQLEPAEFYLQDGKVFANCYEIGIIEHPTITTFEQVTKHFAKLAKESNTIFIY